MFIVTARLDVAAHDRDRFLALMVPVVAETRQEPGCLEYVIGADPTSDTGVFMYERWTTTAALADHLASEHTAAARKAMAGLEILAPPTSRRYEISAERDDILADA